MFATRKTHHVQLAWTQQNHLQPRPGLSTLICNISPPGKVLQLCSRQDHNAGFTWSLERQTKNPKTQDQLIWKREVSRGGKIPIVNTSSSRKKTKRLVLVCACVCVCECTLNINSLFFFFGVGRRQLPDLSR